jgi:hypothetical protein
MKRETYARNIAARAFDVARYLLFLGIPTGVGQVTSIRTLEKQIRRLKASGFEELRSLAAEMAAACAAPPVCGLDSTKCAEPLAPTLAKYVNADAHAAAARADLAQWAADNLPARSPAEPGCVDLIRPAHTPADIVATLLYPVTDWPFRELYEMAAAWSAAQRAEVIDLAVRSRSRRDEMLREFRGGLYAFDLLIDIGAYRDLHRHRRCQQFRQAYTPAHGYETPALINENGPAAGEYRAAMDAALACARTLPQPAAQYLLPFGCRSRFLFKMDFAEAEYICRVRSGVKGHLSYRRVAWEMREKLAAVEPELGKYAEATPPWIEDPLQR